MKLTRLVALLVMAACSRHEVSLVDRPCDGTSCASGYACFNGICRAVDDSGVSGGGACSTRGSVAPCDAAAIDCSHGCMQCDGSAWGACAIDCAVVAHELIEPESCDGVDNDCDGIVDESEASGCVQRFHDGDGDGFGSGTPRCACDADPDGYTAVQEGDCDDADVTVFPGASDVCKNCATRVVANTDHDGDGISRCQGDCDDDNEHVHPGALETVLAGNCVDGIDNDCNGASDCGEPACVWAASAYTYARVLTVTPHPTLGADLGVEFGIDHASLRASGHAADDAGADVRIFYNDGGIYREIARQLGITSAWNTGSTILWFASQAALTAPSTSYVVVYGASGVLSTAPPTDTGVFSVFESFDGPSAPLGSPWVVTGDGVTRDSGVATMNGISNALDNPTMSLTFPALSNHVVLVIGTRFIGDEGAYAVWMHMGHAIPDSTTMPDTTGSAAVFAWGKHGGFGPSLGARHYTAVTGVDSFTHADFGPSDDGAPDHRLTARVNLTGGTVQSQLDSNTAASLSLTDPTTTSVDGLRFVNWESSNVVTLAFRYVTVRAAAANDATVTVGPELAVGPCQ